MFFRFYGSHITKFFENNIFACGVFFERHLQNTQVRNFQLLCCVCVCVCACVCVYTSFMLVNVANFGK